VVEGPQNPEEARIASDSIVGPMNLRIERFITGPMKAEAKKTAEEWKQADPWSLHPSQEALWHRQKALGHGLATMLPGFGPAAAQAGEQIGTQIGTGDYAGAAGTLAANAALYLAPKVIGTAGKLAQRSETLMRTIPRGVINRLIRPGASDVRFGKDPAAGILHEGITGNTLEAIGNKVSDKLAEIGKQLDREARSPANARNVVDVSQSLKPLDNAMREAAQAGDQELFNKLRATRDELSNNWKPLRTARGDIVLRRTGPRNMRMSPAEALQFKRMIGDRVRWTGEPLQGATNRALGSVYSSIKDSLNTAVPALKDLNERYSNLVGAAKSIQRRLPVAERNAHWSLSDIVIAGHSIPLALTRKLARSPMVTSRGAQALYSLPSRTIPKTPLTITAPVAGARASSNEK
jgi:hypothetical protein